MTAIVRASNLLGDGQYSEPNLAGTLISTTPVKMSKPQRGF